MKLMGWISVLLVIGILSTCCGCSSKPGKPVRKLNNANKAKAPLPDWAPKNPSSEFLRAAKVLKPMPAEIFEGAAKASEATRAILQRYTTTYPALYEFFGSLSNEQQQHFLATGEIRVPINKLTAIQRNFLNKWFDNYRSAMKGSPPDLADYLVALYKNGAKKDLSNVEVGFTTKAVGKGHLVHIWFWITKPDGTVSDLGTAFAQI